MRARFACLSCGQCYAIECDHGRRCWRCFLCHAEKEVTCALAFNRIFLGYLECRRALYDVIEAAQPVRWGMAEDFRLEVEHTITHVRERMMRHYVEIGAPWGESEEGLDHYLLELRHQAEDFRATRSVPPKDFVC
jgi:hypothetical protein